MCRLRTGYERVIAHRTSSTYAYAAKHDGRVLEVNEKAAMIKIRYASGEIQTLVYGEEYSQCSDMWVTQRLELTVKKGDSFKKGDILYYNKEFFQKDPYSRQVDWKHGTMATVALMDVNDTFEDSSAIAEKFGEKLEISPVQVRTITLGKNTFVHDTVREGQHVETNDPLIVFEDADVGDISTLSTDHETLAFLAKLNRLTPKAKHSGQVVRVEAYYSCPLQEMHPTLAKVVRDAIRLKTERHKFSSGTGSSHKHPQSQPLPKDTKFRGVHFDEGTVVLQYYIQEGLTAGIGDKIVLGTSLKSVIANTMTKPPVTESGLPVDVLFSATSISNRIVLSPMIIGMSERVLEKVQEDFIAIYDGK